MSNDIFLALYARQQKWQRRFQNGINLLRGAEAYLLADGKPLTREITLRIAKRIGELRFDHTRYQNKRWNRLQVVLVNADVLQKRSYYVSEYTWNPHRIPPEYKEALLLKRAGVSIPEILHRLFPDLLERECA